VYLPPLTTGQSYSIEKIDASAHKVLIYPHGSETIEGNTVVDLRYQYETLDTESGPGYWRIV
jgi:hypothetical protein